MKEVSPTKNQAHFFIIETRLDYVATLKLEILSLQNKQYCFYRAALKY